MTPEEIRNTYKLPSDDKDSVAMKSEEIKLVMLRELTAQIAELVQTIKDIKDIVKDKFKPYGY